MFCLPLVFACLLLVTSAERPGRQGHTFTRFQFLNNSTLPLNYMGMPNVFKIYPTLANDVSPGQTWSLDVAAGIYEIFITVFDGHNGFLRLEEGAFGFYKHGFGFAVSFGASLGVANMLAVSAATVVGASISMAAAPAVLISLATTASYFGVKTFSGLVVCALADASFEFARERLDQMQNPRCISGHTFLGSGQERYMRFSDVVHESPIRDAVQAAYPNLDMEKAVLSQPSAETFVIAMHSNFKDWRVVKWESRSFVITGGFVNPQGVKDNFGGDWTSLDFVPLQIGEVKPTHMCEKPKDSNYWQLRRDDCIHGCHAAMPRRFKSHRRKCRLKCIRPFKQAVEAEEKAAKLRHRVKVGGTVKLASDVEKLKHESALIGLTLSEEMHPCAGSVGVLLSIDLDRLRGKVRCMQKEVGLSVEGDLPLAALVWGGGDSPEAPILTPSGIEALATAHIHGQCWGRRKSKWCPSTDGDNEHVANFDAPTFSLDLGRLCTADDQCGAIGEAGEAGPWRCAGDRRKRHRRRHPGLKTVDAGPGFDEVPRKFIA